MLTPDEWIRSLTDEKAIRGIASFFDLTRDQTLAAMAALTPALMAAMGRASASGSAFPQWPGAGFPSTPDMSRLLSPEAMEAGNAFLGRILGSQEVSRAIADHAARISQVNADTMQRLLPVLALMLAGAPGTQGETPGRGTPANPFAAFFDNVSPDNARKAEPAQNPFAEAYAEFFRKMQPPSPSRQASPEEEFIESSRKLQQEYFEGIERILAQFRPADRK